jgi:hypothetical protein
MSQEHEDEGQGIASPGEVIWLIRWVCEIDLLARQRAERCARAGRTRPLTEREEP